MVRFDTTLNTYTYKGRSYVRASSLYGFYKVPFDPIAESIKYAAKHGRTPEYWQNHWASYSGERADMGSRFHDYKERVTKDRRQYSMWRRPIRYRGDVVERKDPDYYNNWPDGVYTEVLLWHHGLRLAGRCDVVILETIEGIRYMHLDDYKTCERIDIRGFSIKDSGIYAKMLPPISHIEDCNLNHFGLQLSTYQLCGEFLGFKPGDRRVLHHPQTMFSKLSGVEEFEETPTIHPLPYYKKEVISMANHYHATIGKR
jgi:hypothetical protein